MKDCGTGATASHFNSWTTVHAPPVKVVEAVGEVMRSRAPGSLRGVQHGTQGRVFARAILEHRSYQHTYGQSEQQLEGLVQ